MINRTAQPPITGDEAGQRIDNYLLRTLKDLPRPRVYRLLRRGEVRVNSCRVGPSYRLQAGDCLRLPPALIRSAPTAKISSKSLLKLTAELAQNPLYEDRDLLVVNKPAGLAVHGGSGIAFGLIEALREACPNHRFLELGHRLDRSASGCLAIAKTRSMLRHLHAVLRERQADKRYLALCAGSWPAKLRKVDMPLAMKRFSSGRRSFPAKDGRASCTLFVPRRLYPEATLLEARPLTGRLHQIRAHAEWAGHPLAGDERYGEQRFNQAFYTLAGMRRLFLHASVLRLPGKDRSEFVEARAPLPNELRRALNALCSERATSA